MPFDLTASDGDHGLHYGVTREPAEKSDRQGLAETRERHEESKVQSRRRRGDCGNRQKAAGPAMDPDVPGAQARRELERCEEKEEAAWDDVEKRGGAMGGEPAVEKWQLLCPLPYEWVVAAKSVKNLLTKGLDTTS